MFTLLYPTSSGIQPVLYDLLAIWDQSNGLATALHTQCGMDKIVALEARRYSSGGLRSMDLAPGFIMEFL